MKSSIWLSLLVFILLMCSCKTQKLDSNVKVRSEIRSDLAYLNDNIKVRTKGASYITSDMQNIVIEEQVKVTEYDAESGKPIKETDAKRKITQDSDKVIAEEGQERVESRSKDSLNHFRDTTEKMESEVKEESEGGEYAFGKWFAIGIVCLIGGILVYLKMR